MIEFKKQIGIIGNGFVGNATLQLTCKDISTIIYDINPDLCNPLGTIIEDLLVCDSIFISVPTPMNNDGSCYLDSKKVINQLNDIVYKGFIILRSTVPSGTCDILKCNFMPEFLTEANYLQDFINNKDWIFGILENSNKIEFINYITKLFNLAYTNNRIKFNNLHFVSNKEAEMVKMFKNTLLANKVSFCNEIYQYCSKLNIDYNTIVNLVAKDDRIGSSHISVPGPDGKYGYGGTCFPKDTNSLKYEMEKNGVSPVILTAMKYRNETIDRPEKDWNSNIGRAVVKETKNSINTVLITGGAGFIGSNLCKRLLENNRVICLDNLLTGRMNNINEFMGNPNFVYIKHDIIKPITINEDINEIYHLACPASPVKYQKDPINTLKVNFIGTMNVLELAKEKKSKILLSSTSEIYGEPKVNPQNENYRGNVNTIGIRSC